jgi:hypothetical protein
MMSGVEFTGADAATTHAAAMNAIRAFGTIVTVSPEDLIEIVERQDEPLVVTATAGFFKTEYRYLVSYKGLTFFARTSEALELPDRAEVVRAGSIYLPV